jgi:hypothetical protein
MTLFAFWTLFALAAVVLATSTAALRAALAWPLLVAGFVGGLVLFLNGWRLPEWVVAALVALLAGVQLLPPATTADAAGRQAARGHRIAPALAVVGAGFVAAQAAVFLTDRGAPGLLAWAGSPVLALLSSGLVAGRPSFAPRKLRDEASLFVLAAGLCLAAAPEVISGWRSATALNVAARGAETAIPAWVLAAVGAAALAGAVSRWWRRN